MTNKSFIILILLIFNVLNNSCKRSADSEPIRIKAEIKSRIDFDNYQTDKKPIYLYTQITLINNTDSVLNYWLMSCSWEDNFVFNCNYLNFYFPDCIHNSPQLSKLLPYESKIFNCIVKLNENSNNDFKDTCRIGFIFIKDFEYSLTKDSDFRQLLINKVKRKFVLWSNTFSINN